MGYRSLDILLDQQDASDLFEWIADDQDTAFLWFVEETPEEAITRDESALRQYRDGEIDDDALEAAFNSHSWRAFESLRRLIKQ